MTRIVVVYDEGAATPPEIVASLRGLGEVVFALPPSPHNEKMTPLIEDLGGAYAADLETIRALRPDAVLTFSELQVPLAASFTEALGLPGHSREVAALLTDKHLQRAKLASVDPVPATLVNAGNWAGALEIVGLPAVLKPLRGMGSRDAHFIRTAADLAAAVGAQTMQLEHFIEGRESGPYADYLSVESLVCAGRISHVAMTGKFPLRPPFREIGEFWPPVLPATERAGILDLTTRAIQELGVRTGVMHTEVKLSPDGPHLIEVNGRLAGYLNGISTRAARLDFVRVAAQVALGEDVHLRPPAVDGVFFSFGNLAPRVRGILRSVTGIGDVTRMPGITGYRRYVLPGGTIHDGVGTQRLDLISGQATDHAEMLELVEQARKALTFTFDTPKGRWEVTGQELFDM
jgi:biotin carboxylase